MQIGPDTTVAQVAEGLRTAETVFEVVGIDSCCKRDRKLSDAAAAAGIDLEELVALLREVPQDPAVTPLTPGPRATLSEVTKEVRNQYHRRARRALVSLVRTARMLAGSHGQTFRELGKIRGEVEELTRDLIPHMLREERYLFPYIAAMDGGKLESEMVVPLFGRVEHPLKHLRHDHADDLEAIAKLRELTRNFTPPEGACPGMRRFYSALAHFAVELQEHIDLENDVLFPRAVEVESRLFQSGRM
jgi:regulator of cell morphogenesis and NO signaling